MKTRLEHLKTLREPYRSQAITNTQKLLLSEKERSLSEAIKGGFAWSTSPEGLDYWGEVYNVSVKNPSKITKP